MTPCSDEEYFYKLDNLVIRSTQYLHKTFKIRWKHEVDEDWKDEPDYVQNFFSQHCQSVLEKAMPLQKKILLSSCSLNDWDISLMSLVLLNFGNAKKYKLQNQAVRQLKDLRNDLAHHNSKKITQSEYCEKVKILKQILQILQIKQSEIRKLIEKAPVSSSLDTIERVKKLLKNAEQFIILQDFENALKTYSEAIAIPKVLPVNLGEVYEKRAACYLSLEDEHILDRKHVDQAIVDVEEALRLNKKSWHAHYLKGQCHKSKNNLSKAIRFYEMALAISPMQKKVRQDLDSCRLLEVMQNYNANLNLDKLPMSLDEILKQQETRIGRKFRTKLNVESETLKRCPAILGDYFYYGYDVPQDYAKAVECYMLADNQGYVSGCYSLGLCYFYGHGVEQDMKRSIEMFKRCANMDAKKKAPFEPYTPLGFNTYIALAETDLGRCYRAGTGVEKSLAEAFSWYLKAMEHGYGDAATFVGNLTFEVEGNAKMAEMCWKQGLNLNSADAAGELSKYYVRELEPKLARIMFKIARGMGHSQALETPEEEFNQYLERLKLVRLDLEEEVTTVENTFSIDHKGMTFKERYTHVQKYLDSSSNANMSWGGRLQKFSEYAIAECELKNISGSETAKKVFETFNTLNILNGLLAVESDFSKTYKLKVVNLFYRCTILDDYILAYNIIISRTDKFQKIVKDLFDKTCTQKGDQDMKIRLCYASVNLWPSLKSVDDSYAFGILKEGILRYPENYGYYRILIYCSIKRNLYENALKIVNKALKKFPEKVDLYFFKAHILIKRENVESSKIIAAYKLFLDKAPRDHRLVPEAYYDISFVHMENFIKDYRTEGLNNMDNKILKLIQENFRLGKDAEKDQLPCYRPYGESFFQKMVKRVLEVIDKKRNPDSNDSIAKESVKGLKSVLEQKIYMQSPVRKGLIIQHRGRLGEATRVNQAGRLLDESIVKGKLQQTRAKKMTHLKSITLQEMNPTKDKIFKNRILQLIIIEEPNLFSNSIQLVAEDENGDTTRVYIDINGSEQLCFQRFEIGCRFAVINPYMWICIAKMINAIRINESKCIMYLEKAKDMCRFCGKENIIRQCSKCKRLYCSRECQILDWKLFEHKLICSLGF